MPVAASLEALGLTGAVVGVADGVELSLELLVTEPESSEGSGAKGSSEEISPLIRAGSAADCVKSRQGERHMRMAIRSRKGLLLLCLPGIDSPPL